MRPREANALREEFIMNISGQEGASHVRARHTGPQGEHGVWSGGRSRGEGSTQPWHLLGFPQTNEAGQRKEHGRGSWNVPALGYGTGPQVVLGREGVGLVCEHQGKRRLGA